MAAKLKSVVAAAFLATCLLSQNSDASQVAPLTTFVSGTVAKASDVNGNFSAVTKAVDDNDTRITKLQSNPQISGNITLAEPSTATAGDIMKGTSSFIHDFGTRNTFLGLAAGNFTMLGTDNTAVGFSALSSNAGDGTHEPTGTGGNDNTAFGSQALQLNTNGDSNTAIGSQALQLNTTGCCNTATGNHALQNNTTGTRNAAIGGSALLNNTTGSYNTASGNVALASNTTADYNTASGYQALYNNTTGSNNIALGAGALDDNTTGANNIGIGYLGGGYLTTGSNNIEIGASGVAGESNTIRIGDATVQTRTYISGIYNVGVAPALGMYVNSNGQLGVLVSSRRAKDHIADMGDVSSALMKLRPVTFYYKADRNPKGRTLQYGLVAEEVAEVMPGLVASSSDGRPETVYYQFLAPMLLNEVQKQQHQIEAQTALVAKQRGRIAELERDRREQMTRIEALERRTERLAGLLDRLESTGAGTVAAR